MTNSLIGLAQILLLLGVVTLRWSRRARRATGLPSGKVIYADTSRWQHAERPLFSRQHQLTGKPDYLVREGRAIIPIEVKSSRAPADGPLASRLRAARLGWTLGPRRGRGRDPIRAYYRS